MSRLKLIFYNTLAAKDFSIYKRIIATVTAIKGGLSSPDMIWYIAQLGPSSKKSLCLKV